MAGAPASFIDPVLLSRISDLALLARTVVDGYMHGAHRSIRKGSSMDFAQHRSYQPGDDLRRIDWRVLGRTDRFYIKEFEADTNASVMFALDSSASMDFASDKVSKYDYGRFLIASLAWLSQHQGDRVGLATFTDDLVDVVPPSTRHLQLLLHTLGQARAGKQDSARSGRPEKANPPGRSSAAARQEIVNGIERLTHMATRAGIIVLVTDCYAPPEDLARAATGLRMRGHDVIIFHVVDRAERDLPYTAATTFQDAESGARLPLRPDDLRSKYKTLIEGHNAELMRRFAGAGVDYVRVETDKPLDRALHSYLDRRLAMSRVR